MSIDTSPIQAAVDSQVPAKVPGVSVVAGTSRGISFEAAFGTADLDTGSNMASDTVCNWFSMTKLVTATAVVQLADEGLLDLDAPAITHYEPLARLKPDADARRITIRHLLSHGSGIANPLPLRWVHRADEAGPRPADLLERQLEKHRKLRFRPGDKAAYTNLGYLVLGEIVADISQQSFEDRVRSKIIEPLSMSSTDFTAATDRQWATPYHPMSGIGSRIARLLVPKRIVGRKQGSFVSLEHFYVDGPAYGGLVGPARDAIRFAIASLNDGEIDGTRILSTESAREMRRIISRGRNIEVGLGWFRRGKSMRDTSFVEHLGGGAGFWNCLRVYPEEDRAVVVMGNSTSYGHEAIVRAAKAVAGGD